MSAQLRISSFRRALTPLPRLCIPARGFTHTALLRTSATPSTTPPPPSPASPLAHAFPPTPSAPQHKVKITVDTDLPDVQAHHPRLALYYTIFLTIIAGLSIGFFNYERQQSPIVSSTMYSVRRSPTAKGVLGDGIKFRDPFPWISGSLDILHGKVDMTYIVTGSKGVPAKLHFSSIRRGRGMMFELIKWELILEDGTAIDLTPDEDTQPILANEDEDALLGK
ncbi:cytochrome oxidase complex assembly protein 1-domain-containing protein [Limtongia smithiae]|uniref:cytochrome oxidase complex assembly protein 1-domain-containing protein n=1 Tax=Limtongia smithiae TaxID=1125753 RepID=UPI0034CDA999